MTGHSTDGQADVRTAFWLALGLVLYVYVGYPIVLAVWSRVRARPWRGSATCLPAVSIILAARDEAARLPARLDNLLSLDYPPDRLEIVIVSDGSTDETVAVVSRYVRMTGHAVGSPERPVIRLIEGDGGGKASALNAGVAGARHQVLVFADARQRFARDAVRRLVANFADPAVGGVSGELVLDCELGATDSTVGESVGAYWRYEKWLRAQEALVHSMLGATGAIYALRRETWRELPPGTILDDVLAPMRAVLAGWRVVFDPSARAFDVTSADASAEVRRKTRTLAGNWQLLSLAPGLAVPGRNPVWLQYWSHKIGRLLVPFALLTLLAASVALATVSLIYLVALVAQLVFLALAGYGAWLEQRRVDERRAESTSAAEGRRPVSV
jgi:cellulose synthase/poly-beta-1,6-N-acetylglucosamine synthase-like glycosyltransferase